MAAPDLSPPPLRSTLAQKDGFVATIWERWFQQLWEWAKRLPADFSALEDTVETLDGRVDAVEADVAALDVAVVALDGRTDTLEGAVTSLDSRVDALEAIAAPPTLLRALYYRATDQSIPNNVETVIDFSTADISHANVTTGAAWKFTATTAGDYHVSAGGTLDFPVPAAGTAIWMIGKNGAGYQRIARFQNATGSNCLVGSTLIRLAVGDFIDIRIYQNTGSTRGLEGGRQAWFAIHLLPAA